MKKWDFHQLGSKLQKLRKELKKTWRGQISPTKTHIKFYVGKKTQHPRAVGQLSKGPKYT